MGNIFFGPYGHYFMSYNDLCHLASSVVGPMKQYMCMLKIVTRLPWERFQILIFCMVIACSFPFCSAIAPFCAPGKAGMDHHWLNDESEQDGCKGSRVKF